MLRVQDIHLENKRYFSVHSFKRNDFLALYSQMQKREGPYVIWVATVYVNKTRQIKDRKLLYHIV